MAETYIFSGFFFHLMRVASLVKTTRVVTRCLPPSLLLRHHDLPVHVLWSCAILVLANHGNSVTDLVGEKMNMSRYR